MGEADQTAETPEVGFVDLLAIAVGLQHAPFEYFADVRLVARNAAADCLVAGMRETFSYVRRLLITPALIAHVETNPLVAHVSLDLTELRHLEGERLYYSIDWMEDGRRVPRGTLLLKILGNTFCTSLALWGAERISAFHIVHATRFASDQEQQRTLHQAAGMADRFEGGAEVGVSRVPTATISAYLANSSATAGVDRWPPVRSDRKHTKHRERHDWYVRFSLFEKQQDRRALLQRTKLFTPTQENAILGSGLVPISEEELLGNELSAFAFYGASRLPAVYTGPGQFFWPQEIIADVKEAANGVFLVDRYYQEIISPARFREPSGAPAAAPAMPPKALEIFRELGLSDPRQEPWWRTYEPVLAWSASGKTPLYLAEGLPTGADPEGRPIRDALSRFPMRATARVRYWDVPIFGVTTRAELVHLVEAIRALTPNQPLLFRGQNDHFTVKRDRWINRVLYGREDVAELSLTTTASRAGSFDFDAFLPWFQLDLQGLLYADLPPDAFRSVQKDDEGTLRYANEAVATRRRAWERAGFGWEVTAMAIAQHYGIPTYGLDLTSDLDVALWMAQCIARPYTVDGQSRCWLEPVDRACARPIIYLVSSISEETDLRPHELPGLASLRQQRQSAHLHFGGWGFHMNLCAEEVVAGVFLEAVIPTSHTVGWMYPQPEEDVLFGRLLALRDAKAARGLGWGYDRIIDWRDPELRS